MTVIWLFKIWVQTTKNYNSRFRIFSFVLERYRHQSFLSKQYQFILIYFSLTNWALRPIEFVFWCSKVYYVKRITIHPKHFHSFQIWKEFFLEMEYNHLYMYCINRNWWRQNCRSNNNFKRNTCRCIKFMLFRRK